MTHVFELHELLLVHIAIIKLHGYIKNDKLKNCVFKKEIKYLEKHVNNMFYSLFFILFLTYYVHRNKLNLF